MPSSLLESQMAALSLGQGMRRCLWSFNSFAGVS
jgi:hypothetical protein